MIKLKPMLSSDANFNTNVMSLAAHLVSANRKVTQGILLIIHALIVICEKNFINLISNAGNILYQSMSCADDENCTRFACGLISDLSNYLESDMSQFADTFMGCLKDVLSKPDFGTETKLHAIIAVGDLCLATEANFEKHLAPTMQSLFAACSITINPPQNFESIDLLSKLRDSLIDAFISIIHGM